MQKTQELEIINTTPMIGDIIVIGYDDYHVVIKTNDNVFSCNTGLQVSRTSEYNIIRNAGVKYFSTNAIPSMNVEVNKDMGLDRYILCNGIVTVRTTITNEAKKFLQDYFHKLCAESPSEKPRLLKTISSIHQVEELTDIELSSLHALLPVETRIKIINTIQMKAYLFADLGRANELYHRLQVSRNSLRG